mgnify:CR=1 FL=1|tara:strand:+ start:234 stop:551 length:318 start_codon:yes stop_codon:yes gene_type:complete
MENKHGGARVGAGRKTKANEEQVRRLGLDAIENVYGSIEKYYIHIATESQESFPHLKLLQEYVFGKPKEVLEVINEEVDGIDYNKLTIETLRDLANNTNDKPDES